MKILIEPRTWRFSMDRKPKWWNRNMRFGTWNVRCLYREDSLMTILKELSKKLVRISGNSGGQMRGQWCLTRNRIHIFYGKGMRQWIKCKLFFVHKIIISAVNRAEIVRDMVTYITLKEVTSVLLLFWTFVPLQRIKLMMWRCLLWWTETCVW